MQDSPHRLMSKRKFGHTNHATSVIHAGEGFGEHQFVRGSNKNDCNCPEHQSTSDVGLFEPLTSEERRRVDTFEGDKRGKPK